MPVRFITGNANKFSEARTVIADLERFDLDLPEIQDIDPQAVIAEKLAEALKLGETNIVVEDTSLCLDAMNGLPGPLIKWFMKSMGNEGIVEIATRFGNEGAEARVTIGYADPDGAVTFFEGSIRGRVVPPRGDTTFGWDPIFQPDGHEQTFAEMPQSQKDGISMRKIAFTKLADHLNSGN